MDKASVIKAREVFGTNPIRVISNAMMLYDNVASSPHLIWDDANETVTAFRAAAQESDVGHPISLTVVNYADIYHMEAYLTPSDAQAFIKNNFTGDDEKLAENILKAAIGNHSYTGRNPNRNIFLSDRV